VSRGALLIWPSLLEDGAELSLCLSQPEFRDENWAVWRFRMEGDEAISRAGARALLAYTADGVPPDQIEWVTPDELLDAAERLMQQITVDDPDLADTLWEYEDFSARGASPKQALLDDLEVVRQKAIWAKSLGKEKVCFELT
jgi:hypothetical protein